MKDYNYHHFHGLIQNKYIVFVKGKKHSSIVIMEKLNYVVKLNWKL